MLTWQRLACRDPTTPITIYHIGNPGEKEHWWDLCAGPHVESTGDLVSEAIELERTAGAYWRGDESRQMLTRVYGTAWQSELQLEAYRFRQEEARKRDHRKLGRQLSLFTIEVQHDLVLACKRSMVLTPAAPASLLTCWARRTDFQHSSVRAGDALSSTFVLRAGGCRWWSRVLVTKGCNGAQHSGNFLEGHTFGEGVRSDVYSPHCKGGPLEDVRAL